MNLAESTPATQGERHLARRWVLRRLRAGQFELLPVALFDLLLGTGSRSPSTFRRVCRLLVIALVAAMIIAAPTLLFKSQTQATRWRVWLWGNMVGVVASISAIAVSKRFFSALADGVIPGLVRDEDVILLGRWLRRTFAMPRQILFTVVILTITVPLATYLVATFPKSQLAGTALMAASSAMWLGGSGGWYLLVAMLMLPTTLTRLALPLFPFDPAHSRPIEALTSLTRLGLVLAGGNAMLLAIGVVWWDPLEQSHLAIGLGMLWLPFIAVFTYHHIILSSIIKDAKRRTIDVLEQQIQDIAGEAKSNWIESAKPILDARERVAKTRNAAIDWRQILALATCITLPALPPALKMVADSKATASSSTPAKSEETSSVAPLPTDRPDNTDDVSTAPAAAADIPDATANNSSRNWASAPRADIPPASFAGRRKVPIDDADELGCEARTASGFLELLCRSRDRTGGHPLRAEYEASADGRINVDTGSNEGASVLADGGSPSDAGDAATDAFAEAEAGMYSAEDSRRVQYPSSTGELRLVLRFREGETHDVTLEFSDTRYILHLRDTTASLEWASGTPMLLQACAVIQSNSQQVLADAQREGATDRVLPTDLAGLPPFGECYVAGFGAWALALTKVTASGSNAERKVTADVEVVYVSQQAEQWRVPFATFEFPPNGIRLGPLETYDYDADGRVELIVPYEFSALPKGASQVLPPFVWSISDTSITPYDSAPESGGAGIAIERLRGDVRPNIGVYEPYVAWFDSDCGSKRCPSRLTGPLFVYDAQVDGQFSLDNDSCKAALKRACPSKPTSVVVPASPERTAMNLVCSRLRGVPEEGLLRELAKKRSALCRGAPTCPLATTLEAWTKLTPPATLG